MFQPRQTPYPNGSSPSDSALFKGALQQLHGTYLGHAFPHTVGGKTFYAKSDETYDSVDPNDTSFVVARFPKHDLTSGYETEFLDDCLGLVAQAHERWRLVPLTKRIELIEAISDIAQQRQWLFMAAMAIEGGKRPFPNGYGEMEEVIDFPMNNAELAKQMYQIHSPKMPKWMCDQNGYQWLPKGPIVTIDPFNFAGAIPIDKVSAALVTGSAVVMKASGHTPLQGYLLYQLVDDAFTAVGLENNGVVSFISGHGGEMAMHLLNSPYINGYAFTGSHDVLRTIRRAMLDKKTVHGGEMQCVAAETSGRNPMVVAPDANIDNAVKFAVASLINNNGQTCSHLGDLVLHKDIANEFRIKLYTVLNNLNYGDVKDLKNHCGALISQQNVDRYEGVVKEQLDKGLVVLMWQKFLNYKPSDRAFDFSPRVLLASDATLNNDALLKKVRDAEIFAPAVTIWEYETLAEMRRICMASKYRLTAALHTSDAKLVRYFVTEVPCAGQIYINGGTTGALVGQAFGGHGLSASSIDGVGASTLAALMKYVSHTNVAVYYPRDATLAIRDRWDATINELTTVAPQPK